MSKPLLTVSLLQKPGNWSGVQLCLTVVTKCRGCGVKSFDVIVDGTIWYMGGTVKGRVRGRAWLGHMKALRASRNDDADGERNGVFDF